MIRFVSGFIFGYMVAKRPPTEQEIHAFKQDIQRSLELFGIKFGSP
mgnify:CR=1 FL=1